MGPEATAANLGISKTSFLHYINNLASWEKEYRGQLLAVQVAENGCRVLHGERDGVGFGDAQGKSFLRYLCEADLEEFRHTHTPHFLLSSGANDERGGQFSQKVSVAPDKYHIVATVFAFQDACQGVRRSHPVEENGHLDSVAYVVNKQRKTVVVVKTEGGVAVTIWTGGALSHGESNRLIDALKILLKDGDASIKRLNVDGKVVWDSRRLAPALTDNDGGERVDLVF